MAIVAKFPNVEGESGVEGYAGWVDIQSISEGVSSPTSREGGGLSGGKSDLMPITFTASSGKHIAGIVKGGTGGKHFPKIEIEFLLQTGEKLEKYRSLTLEKAYIASWSFGASGEYKGSDSFQVDVEKATWEYFVQDAAGGVKSSGTASYDMKTGVTS